MQPFSFKSLSHPFNEFFLCCIGLRLIAILMLALNCVIFLNLFSTAKTALNKWGVITYRNFWSLQKKYGEKRMRHCDTQLKILNKS